MKKSLDFIDWYLRSLEKNLNRPGNDLYINLFNTGVVVDVRRAVVIGIRAVRTGKMIREITGRGKKRKKPRKNR